MIEPVGNVAGDAVPSVYVQWKGTDVCVDLRCPCGDLGHFDGHFAYFLECGSCGRVFRLPDTLLVYPLVEGEVPFIAPRVTLTDADEDEAGSAEGVRVEQIET